ncbi:MAG: hypothetical protein ABIS07_08120 [Dokdonella sp.]
MTAPLSSLSTPWRIGIVAILALVMVATRSHLLTDHFFPLPDASWALFFIAGFYLRGSARWAFPALMVLAVAIDYIVIDSQGLSFWEHYCVSPAYWFLLPSYAALWFGGSWLRSHYAGMHVRELALLIASAIVVTSVCYVISNGSFYWLSQSWIHANPNAPVRSLGGWIENLGDWYLPFVRTTLIYVGVGAGMHVATITSLKALGGNAKSAQSSNH